MSKTIAIVSGKGGTGKTSITTAVGYILSFCGFKTLLMDMDLYTHGLTFYLSGNGNASSSLSDLYTSDDKGGVLPQRLTHPFAQGNLYLAPSLSSAKDRPHTLQLNPKFQQLGGFRERLSGLIEGQQQEHGFEYILLDTRGGTDITSIGCVLAAKSFLMVTEADKPSWDMGEVLLDSIFIAEKEQQTYIHKEGFLINKNVLPSKEIEAFLVERWKIPHLGTLPLDKQAIRYFQEDKSPLTEDPDCPFSERLIDYVTEHLVGAHWSSQQVDRLQQLKRKSVFQSFMKIFRF